MPRELTQAWPKPSHPRPIVIIGAGAIARTAHLPVYRRLGFPVAGVFDINRDVARATAETFGIERAYDSLDEACAGGATVFDIAVPGDQILPIIEQVPEGAAVLIQKPMGRDLLEARAIRRRAHERRLIAAVNFQLRFSPGMLALHDLIERGELGSLVDVDVRIVIDQPWHLWTF